MAVGGLIKKGHKNFYQKGIIQKLRNNTYMLNCTNIQLYLGYISLLKPDSKSIKWICYKIFHPLNSYVGLSRASEKIWNFSQLKLTLYLTKYFFISISRGSENFFRILAHWKWLFGLKNSKQMSQWRDFLGILNSWKWHFCL